jgi:S-adenosylmethionine:tRNA ribosyltransferase-isomerase
MLVVDGDGTLDSTISVWPSLLTEGALVVVNDTRVFKARLLGKRRPTGGRVELLLLSENEPKSPFQTRQLWHALGRASKPLVPGTLLEFQSLLARVVERCSGGELLVELESDESITTVIDRIGHVPIPPYLGRQDEDCDGERYQTLYAKHTGSVAAPTAGLHLAQSILDALTLRGVLLDYVTLHVGIGTFRPVQVDELDEHEMHTEKFEVSEALVTAIAEARHRQSPIIAVGTTVVRALESAADPDQPGRVRAQQGSTNLLIQPGYQFKVVDSLLTNFHLPRSTLLALVGAFAGLDRTIAAYRLAIQRKYRFLSYGDAMWIPKRI